MLLNLNRVNKSLWFVFIQFWACTDAYGQVFQLSSDDIDWLGERIFINECAARFDCITSWNKGEEFPSLGIGHFIWYQAEQKGPFEETFPALVNFMASRHAEIPKWLLHTKNVDSPWESRAEFYENFNSPDMVELREFLAAHRSLQVEFILQRLNQSLKTIISGFPLADRPKIRNIVQSIANSHERYGTYALIDYVHFKGTGLTPTEKYKNQGWGLKQILEKMMASPPTLYSFVQAAKSVLETRVTNAPLRRNEQQWLPGWKKRVESYLPPNQ